MHKPSELSSYSLNVTKASQSTLKLVQSALPIVEEFVKDGVSGDEITFQQTSVF